MLVDKNLLIFDIIRDILNTLTYLIYAVISTAFLRGVKEK